jgi:hypothetical protein
MTIDYIQRSYFVLRVVVLEKFLGLKNIIFCKLLPFSNELPIVKVIHNAGIFVEDLNF